VLPRCDGTFTKANCSKITLHHGSESESKPRFRFAVFGFHVVISSFPTLVVLESHARRMEGDAG
jgi:hypothetical protein